MSGGGNTLCDENPDMSASPCVHPVMSVCAVISKLLVRRMSDDVLCVADYTEVTPVQVNYRIMLAQTCGTNQSVPS